MNRTPEQVANMYDTLEESRGFIVLLLKANEKQRRHIDNLEDHLKTVAPDLFSRLDDEGLLT